MTYTLTVTNAGGGIISNIQVTDPIATVVCDADGSVDDVIDTVLAVGASQACIATHILTQPEIDSGQLTNQATATATVLLGGQVLVADLSDDPNDATDVEGETPSDGGVATGDSGSAEPDDPTVVALIQNRSIAVNKTANPTNISGPQTINYTITVINDGDTTLTNVDATDTLPDGSSGTLSGPIEAGGTGTNGDGILDVGETWTYTTAFIADQADINAGATLTNNVSVETSEITTPQNASADTTITQDSSIVVGKAVDQLDISQPGTLNYTITILNDGNVTQTAVQPTDTLPDGNTGVLTLPIETGGTGTNGDSILDVGETWTYTTTFAADQSDINGGADLVNTISVVTAGITEPETATATTSITQTPGFSANKIVDSSNISTPTTLNYTITLLNTGNVSLTGVTPTDTLPDSSTGVLSGPAETGGTGTNGNGILDVGETWTYTTTFDADQGDIDAGTTLVNTVSVTANQTSGPEADTAETTITQNPTMTVIKVVDLADIDAPATLNYTITVENTGNISLTGVTPTDTLPDNSPGSLTGPTETGGSGSNSNGILDLGETFTYTTTYDADQTDINAGTTLTNTISVVTAQITEPETDTADTTITQLPSIRVTKNRTGITGVGGDGDTVTYDIIVENTGGTTVLDIVVTDPDADVTGNPINSLAIGESVTLTAVQTIDPTDVANGFVQNSATATGDSSPTSTDNVIDVSDAGVDADGVVIPDNENVETGPPNGNPTDDPTITTLGVALQARVMLQGALNVPGSFTFTTIMRDALRQADQAPSATTNFLPDTEQYTNLGFTHVGDGGGETVVNPATVFADNGNDSIVDWVFVELRDASDNTAVIATRAGLVQRDGDVVDVDGVSSLVFSSTAAADYFVSINHRNHLGVMTEATSALSSIPTVVDFTDPGIALFHLTTSNDGLEQFQVPNESLQALWAGDVALDNTVVFAGQDNDSSSLFDNVVLDPGNVFNSTTFPLSGYHQSDVNMNSVGVFSGQNNDRDFIFANTDLHPNNIFSSSTFTITEQLP